MSETYQEVPTMTARVTLENAAGMRATAGAGGFTQGGWVAGNPFVGAGEVGTLHAQMNAQATPQWGNPNVATTYAGDTTAVPPENTRWARNDLMGQTVAAQPEPPAGLGYDVVVDHDRVVRAPEPVRLQLCMFLSAVALLFKKKGLIDDGEYQLLADIDGRSFEDVLCRLIDVASHE